MIWKLLTLCAAAAFFPLAAVAEGVNETYPSEIRVITATDATSDCIDDPRTPVCAVETLLACFARREKSLCQRVGVDYVPPGPPLAKSLYRFLSVRILTEADMIPERAHTNWWKPGYANIVIQEPDDHMNFCDPDGGGCRTNYSVRPGPEGWEVVDWAVWGVEEHVE